MLSLTLRYGLSAAVLLASREGDSFVKVKDLSTQLGVPRSVLAKTLQHLGTAGLVDTLRGPHGGCRWIRGSEEITVADLAQILGAMPTDRGCILGPSLHDQTGCLIPELSPQVLIGAMQELTIAELVRRQQAQPVARMPSKKTKDK